MPCFKIKITIFIISGLFCIIPFFSLP